MAEWISPSGFSSLIASTESQSEHGLTSVPGDATPGTYTVVITCANRPEPVGEATFEVDRVGRTSGTKSAQSGIRSRS